MNTKLLRFILFLLVIQCLFASDVFGQKKQTCLVKYNEYDNKGQQHNIIAIAWFDLLPEIPSYTYFDKDLGKTVVIKTTINAYKNDVIAQLGEYKIKAGNYAIIYVECPDKKQIQLFNVEELLPDFKGENLAFEVKPSEQSLTFYFYPFENDFPFKFEEDLIKKTILLTDLNNLCQ